VKRDTLASTSTLINGSVLAEHAAVPSFPFTATALILAAAMPLRIRIGFAVFGSFTILDVALLLAAARVLFGSLSRYGRVPLGDRWITLLLAVPLAVCIVSLLWTEDLRATVRSIAIFAEAMVAYWVVLSVFGGLTANQLFTRVSLLVTLLLTGSLLSVLQISGFAPQIPPDMRLGSPEHIDLITTYYARLSNPFYGLSNDFASVLALYVFPLLAWGVVTKQLRFSFLAALVFTGIMLTFSRGVALATIIGGVFLTVSQRRESARWIPGLALGVILLAAVGYGYYALNPAVQTYLIDRLSGATIEARQTIIFRTIELIIDAPALGYGGGVIPDPLLKDGVHNTYLQQIVYYGIPLGFLCSAALWLLAARFWFLPIRFPRVRIMASAIGASVLIQLMVFLVETSFEATLPKTAFYFFVALGWLILARMHSDARHRSTSLGQA
jgi:O-antigen ligase